MHETVQAGKGGGGVWLRTFTSRMPVAKTSLATSTSRLMATGWKLYLPSSFLAMCTSTGASPMKKQSAATRHTCPLPLPRHNSATAAALRLRAVVYGVSAVSGSTTAASSPPRCLPLHPPRSDSPPPPPPPFGEGVMEKEVGSQGQAGPLDDLHQQPGIAM